jgi:hypothetical protein
MTSKTDGTKTRNLPDLAMDDTVHRALVMDLTTQYRGNRVTSRFYPDQYAKVVYARWLSQRYGRMA